MMNKLYNKILTEALDIMDFDSWDDSEQSFKDTIKNVLIDCFVYIARNKQTGLVWIKPDGYASIKIFSSNWAEKGKTRFNDKIYLKSGKKINMEKSTQYFGWTKDRFELGEYEIIIKDLDTIKTCKNIFFRCDGFESTLRKAALWDTSHIKDMEQMFADCHDLEEVPVYNMENVNNAKYMFSNCSNLSFVKLKNVKNLKNIDGMFMFCSKLKNVNFDVIPKGTMFSIPPLFACDQLSEETKERFGSNWI